MIAVLSWLLPRLEDALTSRGEQVVAVIPEVIREIREKTNRGYPILTVPEWDNYDALTRLAGELEGLGVTRVVTVDEACIVPAAFLRGLLGLPGQSLEDAIACTDKAIMKRRLARAGIPVAEYRVVRSVAEIGAFLEDVGADIVVKPRAGVGSVNTNRVGRDSFDRLVAEGAFDPPRDLPVQYTATSVTREIGQISFMAERFVEVVAEYHCELLRYNGTEVHCVVGRYPNPLLSDIGSIGAVFLDPDSEEAQTVRELTRGAATALGVTHGFGHCEVFRDRFGRWLVGEFAARPGGARVPQALQLAYGIDNLSLMADLIAGHRPVSGPSQRAPGFVAWASIPTIGSGVIRDLPTEAELLSLPGVIAAEIAMRPGDTIGALYTTTVYAGYVFCLGETPGHAEELARRARNACRIVAEPLVEVLA